MIELLETRTLLSASLSAATSLKPVAGSSRHAVIDVKIYHKHATGVKGVSAGVAAAQPNNSSSVVGLTPTTIRHAYGVDQVMFGSIAGSGAGQTIALIDAYDSPTAYADLHHFDSTFGLSDPPSFKRVAQDGTTNFPATDPAGAGNANGTWELETALDVEWAHVMAPQANILLVEATTSTYYDLIQVAANYARSQPGVSVVSMSFGGPEFSTETQLDPYLTTPSSHAGVTFVASTGDSGAPGEYPAYSPNVVAVGGTKLNVDSSGSYLSESGWSGSGGGVSQYELQPTYQKGVVTQAKVHRTIPDISLNADPASGVAVYDSYDYPSAPWIQVGGTSLAAPLWSGVLALANQGRALKSLPALDGATQTLPNLYTLPSADLHDITSGNNGHATVAGYDLVTGRGSPVVNRLVFDLGGVQASAFPTGIAVNGTAGNDTIYLRRNGSLLGEWINAAQPGVGTPTHQDALTGISTLSIHGGGGSDVVTIDESGGEILVQTSNLDNAGGTIALALVGTASADTLAIASSGTSLMFNSSSLILSNVVSILYTDTSGGDTINTATPAPVTLNITSDDDITVSGGNTSIVILDTTSSPSPAIGTTSAAIVIDAMTPSAIASPPPRKTGMVTV